MHHNKFIKDQVRQLRLKGLSLNSIFNETRIPKTTIRSWIKDIQLSSNQIRALQESTQNALQAGRIKNQKLQKELKYKKEQKLTIKAINQIKTMTKRDILIAGVALYWAEGFKNKHEHRLGFCNSDPEMIKFYIMWLRQVFNVKNEDLIARLSLNESYKDKTKELENYWSNLINIPISQFSRAFYQKTKWKKQYNSKEYHGVLRIHVQKSLDQLFLTKGWIEGLKLNVLK